MTGNLVHGKKEIASGCITGLIAMARKKGWEIENISDAIYANIMYELSILRNKIMTLEQQRRDYE